MILMSWLTHADAASSGNFASRHFLCGEIPRRNGQSVGVGPRTGLSSVVRINAGTWCGVAMVPSSGLRADGCGGCFPRMLVSIGAAILLGFPAAASGAPPSASNLGAVAPTLGRVQDRKSTRLNSSH